MKGLKELFVRCKFEVYTAETLEESVELMDVQRFDYIISNLNLDNRYRKEGFRILGYAKRKYQDTKVIIMSGHADRYTKERGRPAWRIPVH